MLAYNDDMHPIYSGSQLLVQLAGVSVDGLLILLSAGQPDVGMGSIHLVSQSASREAQISSFTQCIHTHSTLLDCANLGLRVWQVGQKACDQSLGGGFPVNVRINSVLITFSRCWKWLLRFDRMRDK